MLHHATFLRTNGIAHVTFEYEPPDRVARNDLNGLRAGTMIIRSAVISRAGRSRQATREERGDIVKANHKDLLAAVRKAEAEWNCAVEPNVVSETPAGRMRGWDNLGGPAAQSFKIAAE